MSKEDGRKKQPFNEIDTECLDYIVNELKNNKSMQQMLNYYKGKYYSERYWELKKQVDKAIETLGKRIEENEEIDYVDMTGKSYINYQKEIIDILRGKDNEK